MVAGVAVVAAVVVIAFASDEVKSVAAIVPMVVRMTTLDIMQRTCRFETSIGLRVSWSLAADLARRPGLVASI